MRLSTREIAVVAIGAVVVVFMASWLLVVEPVGEKLALLDRKLTEQLRSLERVGSTPSSWRQNLSIGGGSWSGS